MKAISFVLIICGLNFHAAVNALWNLILRHEHVYEFETNVNIRGSIFRGHQSKLDYCEN